MKRKTLLLMLLMALFAPWTAKAQETPRATTATLPWSENFSSTSWPSDWYRPVTYDGKPVIQNYSWGAYSDPYCLELRATSGSPNMVILPQFNQPLNTLTISFKYGRGNTSGGYSVKLGYVTSTSATSLTGELTTISEPAALSSHSDFSFTVPSSAPSGTNYRLAIYFTRTNSTADSWYLDDFSVTYTEPSGGDSGDSDCAEIGTGTSTTGYAPIYGNFKSSYAQMIYTASQLQNAGITQGSIIKIGFNSSASNQYSRKPIIYMGTTSKSSFSSNTDFIDINSLTKVYDYNNHSQWNITSGWNEFELDTPFEYDGSSNLVIAMHCGLISDYSSSNFYYTSTTNSQVIYAYSDSYDPVPATHNNNWSNYSGSKSTTTYLPNVRLYIEEPTTDTCEDFESGSMPSGWTSEGTGSWVVKTGDHASSTGAHGGTYNVSRPHANRNEVCYLVMPAQDFSAVNSATLNFWYINRNWSGDIDYLEVCYRIGSGNWTSLWNTTTNHESWTEQSVNLTGLAANYQIGFKYTDNYGYDVSIDDICIETTGGSTPTYITEIATVADWEAFCASVNSGLDYSGKTVTMTADVGTVSTMCGTVTSGDNASPANCFSGIFDGQGHTLNVSISNSTDQGTAPFRSIYGATIQNLKVTGSVTSTTHGSGLVGFVKAGTDSSTIENCQVSTNVNSTNSHIGGIVGHAKTSTVVLTGCVYDGLLTSSNWKGGLIGWADAATVQLTDCLFNGTVSTTSNFHPIGCKDGSSSVSGTVTNCYYYATNSINSQTADDHGNSIVNSTTGKGKRAYSITGQSPVTVANAGNATTYGGNNVTHYITGYGTGIKYNDVLYAGNSDQVSLTLGCSVPSGQELNGYTASNGGTLAASGNNYILTMPNNNTVISADISTPKYHIANTASSTQMTWDQFVTKVNGGTNYSGQTIYLDENITISTQVGISESKCFKGTFDGQTHTLTLSGGTFGTSSSYNSNQYVAPFRNINGTTIQNLVVAGSLYTSAKFAAGVAAYAKGNNTITNCKVTAAINSSVDGDGTHGGIVAHVADGLTTITGCVFNGQLLGSKTTYCGGIIGYTTYSDDVRINHCIFDPTNVTFSSSNSNPICRNTSASYITNCYYTSTALGTGFGRMRHTVTMGSGVSTMTMSGTATANNVSGITYYASNSGLLYNSTIIAGEGDNVSLTLSGASEYEADYGTLTGSGNPYTLAMPNRDVVISGLSCPVPTDLTYSALGSTYVTLKWTPGGEEKAWQVKYYTSGSEDNPIATYSVTGQPTDTITGLTKNTVYYAKVRAVCDAETNSAWSDEIEFDPDDKSFENSNGNNLWNDPDNWTPYGVPTLVDDVIVNFDVTIPEGCQALANTVTINVDEEPTITIEDGGQLWHNNEEEGESSITVTIKKTIDAYEGDDYLAEGNNKGFEIISFPIDGLYLEGEDVDGLIPAPEDTENDPYAFYAFVPYNTDSDGTNYLEWVHYGSDNFGDVNPYRGYLYSRRDGTEISVTGEVMSSGSPATGDVYKLYGGERFDGWALMGNPFVCNAYVTANEGEMNFYKIGRTTEQQDYDEFVPFDNSTPIEPMGGVMVRFYEDMDGVVYSRELLTGEAKSGILNMVARKANSRASASRLDRARLRFSEGRNLPKLQLNPNHTKVYIPEGAKDYAVYYTEGAGSVPVNFKAEENGRYTLDFSTENVSFNYLHLIDNMTGADVDLLETPYYTFSAKSTDYESRFKVVFATGEASNDDNFAFYSNGSWVVNNEGDATLQVIDVLGHVLSTDRISGATTKAINAASGIYMLRLINGDNVRVQKIVVR